MTPTAATQARIAPRRVGETLIEPGAKRLASIIERYWRGRGYQGIAIEHDLGWAPEDDRERANYAVRSNLGPLGFPPRGAARFGVAS
jgi:hypothetical protein